MIFLFYHIYDLAPITIIEALGHGCMVLCSNFVVQKIILRSFNGYIFQDNNQKSLISLC